MQLAKEHSDEIPFTKDHNTGNTIGLGWTQNTIGGGKRASAATAYLHNGASDRSNLAVLLHAHVTKLVKTGEEEGVSVFKAVEFAQANKQTPSEVPKFALDEKSGCIAGYFQRH
jgi:choline dehydrogenase-like flavoprotein